MPYSYRCSPRYPQPLALLEVGASAGLCLYPDRYAYRYGDHLLGSGEPVLQGAPTGTAPPVGVPDLGWRAGVDLNPLDVTDPSDVAWLDALIWPEHAHRRARLRAAAAAVAAADPPLLVRGDLVNDRPALAARAPVGATLVVFHTSVLYQVPAPKRAAFADVVRGLPGHWIANEAPDVLPYDALPQPPTDALSNVLALDGTRLAWTGPHRQAIAGSPNGTTVRRSNALLDRVGPARSPKLPMRDMRREGRGQSRAGDTEIEARAASTMIKRSDSHATLRPMPAVAG